MICIVDLETTSQNHMAAEIIEGHFIVTDYDLEIVSEFELKCRPKKWSSEAEDIHKISLDTASKYPSFSDCYSGLINWLEASEVKEIWCHSNTKMYGKITYYDYAVLRSEMFNVGDSPYFFMQSLRPYSTHSLCKILQGSFDFSGLSLDLICKKLDIKLEHHNAKSDAFACYEIMKKLLPLTNREELYNYDWGVKNDESNTERKTVSPSNGSKKKARGVQSHSFILQN